MKYTIEPTLYDSRRGKYRLVALSNNPMIWKPEPLGTTPRDLGVISEIEAAFKLELDKHPYWQDEPVEFIKAYTLFYIKAFELDWLKGPSDRHNITFNVECCLTTIQYNNGVLYAYSRSTDMRNGFWSDKKVLDYLAQTINRRRPDCKIVRIEWFIAIPHVYEQKGIARLENK